MGSESDVATDWKTHLIIGKNFNGRLLAFGKNGNSLSDIS